MAVILIIAGDRTFTVRAEPMIDPDTGETSYTDAVFEGPHAWDGSGIRHETAESCIAEIVRDVLDTITEDSEEDRHDL